MKKYLIILSIVSFVNSIAQEVHLQSRLDEFADPTTVTQGITYQIGPGSNNNDNWTYPYSVKLTVWGNSARNFEIMNTAKHARGTLAYRTYDSNSDAWTRWREFIFKNEDGNVGLKIEEPVSLLDIGGYAFLRSAPTFNVEVEQLRIGRSDNNVRYHSLFSKHSGGGQNNYLQFRLHSGSQSNTSEQISVMTLNGAGRVGIGTTTPSEELDVNGTVRSKEVKVEATGWPDYVFESDYNLRTLEETEAYIQSNKHLPEIPSAKEMEANGVKLGEINMLLLKKIEELTLHTIQQQKELLELKKHKEEHQRVIAAQGKMIEELKLKVDK